ncbi:hypothetical protein KJ853_02825 [Patescibacteria group bacterium]|nr:hypothetical protein [Patescibacteria group bacterium]
MENIKPKDNSTLISWTAPEFIRYEKSKGWFAAFWLISAAFVIASLLMENYLFTLIIFLAAFLIYVQAMKRPRKINFAISDEKIIIDGKEYLYNDFMSFWIFEKPEINYLSLLSKKMLQPQIHIPLAEQEPEKIRQALKKFIPEKEQKELLLDAITKKLKF